jgi:hypothetical protein
MSDKQINNQYYNFKGLYDKDDSGLIPSNPESGVFASAIQNAICDDGTITFGLGYVEENDGSSVTSHYNGDDDTFIRNGFRLKRRDGEVIQVNQLDNGKLEWLNAVLNRYETLLIGLTTGVDIGMVDFNKTSQDRTYFGDGVNNLSFWSKAIGYYASDDGANVITLTVPNSAHTTLSLAGYSSSGTIVYKDGTTATYSGLSGMTLTGVSALPTTPTVGDGIAEAPDTSTITSSGTKGNILFKYQGRLGVVVEANPTVIYLSKVADGTDFTSTGVDGRIILNVIDGDGRINGVVPFKKRLVVLKEGGIIPVLIEQLDSTTLRTQIEPIIVSDNVGPSSIGQSVTGLDEVYWISSNDKDIKKLSNVGVEKDINLTATKLTRNVERTTSKFEMDDSRMTIFRGDAFFTAQSNSDSELDTIAQYDSEKDTFYFYKIPAFNFWMNSSNKLHFTDPYIVKSFELFNGYDADAGSIGYLWKTGRLNFGTNFYKKATNIFAVFGKMTSSSILTCKIDYNNGSLGSIQWDVNGDGSSKTGGKYILETGPSNPYGQNPYGIVPYGGESSDLLQTNYFLFYKTLPADFNPYDIDISFSAEGDSNYIKIISFGLNPTLRREVSKYRKL